MDSVIIEQVVKKAYKDLIDIAELNICTIGGYIGVIIPKSKIDELIICGDEIINKLFDKFCDELRNKITRDDMEFIIYKSFCYNDPSEKLINDCFKIINERLENKKNSNNATLLDSLNSLKQFHSEIELEKSLNTIFDILLDYSLIVRK